MHFYVQQNKLNLQLLWPVQHISPSTGSFNEQSNGTRKFTTRDGDSWKWNRLQQKVINTSWITWTPGQLKRLIKRNAPIHVLLRL